MKRRKIGIGSESNSDCFATRVDGLSGRTQYTGGHRSVMTLTRAMKKARLFAAVLFATVLTAGAALAAEFRPAPHEVWAGTYRCDAMAHDPEQWPAYSASIRLVLDDGVARIVKESARIRETLSGEVRSDGVLSLDGSGEWKDGSGTRWRYRFDGRFEGSRFEAQGVMLGSATATRLRDCSMALRRVKASRAVSQAAQTVPAPAKVAQAIDPFPSLAQPSPPPSPSPESTQAPAAAEKGPPVVLVAADHSRQSRRDVPARNDGPAARATATNVASERPVTAETGSRFKAEWLVLFLVLAGIAALIDKYFLK